MRFVEGETVELKSMVVDDIKKEVIAFANCKGGTIYVGVADDGSVVGVDVPDETLRRISDMVRDCIKPDVTMFVNYRTEKIEGKEIVVVEVQKGTAGPYCLIKKGLKSDGVFVRQGSSSVPASDIAIRQMIKESDGEHFEEMRSLEQELTFDAVRAEFEKRNVPFGRPQMETVKMVNREGIYSNLAYLLSDQCEHTVKLAVFQGNDQSLFQNRREFTGSVLKQLNDVYDFLDLINPVRASFQGLYRRDYRDYPEVALREALLNSLVHRDYSFSASTLISVYEDRIEFVSVGGLVNGLCLDDVKMGISVCRNPLLANVFYRLELIEAYGTGIQKILNSYKGADVTPELVTSTNAFKIILPNMYAKRGNESFVLRDAEDGRSHYPKEVDEKQKTVIDEEEKTVLELFELQTYITRADVEEYLKVSTSTAFRILKKMAEKGLITIKGKGKNTRYIKTTFISR